MINGNEYTCHSGGAIGSDTQWETIGEEYGVNTIAYSFVGHDTESTNKRIISLDGLVAAIPHLEKANETLKRGKFETRSPYVIKLLCRNWYQVKNSDAIYAIGEFNHKRTYNRTVKGGTGWAVQMAVDNKKDVYVFDQSESKWYVYLKNFQLYVELQEPITLRKNFAGIGTRKLKDNGLNAIKEAYRNTFEK
jgi:hypothetical protein